MRRTDLLVLPLGVGGAIVAAWIFLRLTPFARLASCPLRLLTGIPCPACGGTTAASAILAGDWAGAIRANPLVVVGAAGAVLLSLASLIVLPWADRLPSSVFRPFGRRRALLVLLALLAGNWTYLVVTSSR